MMPVYVTKILADRIEEFCLTRTVLRGLLRICLVAGALGIVLGLPIVLVRFLIENMPLEAKIASISIFAVFACAWLIARPNKTKKENRA
jgi:hypothetical protein